MAERRTVAVFSRAANDYSTSRGRKREKREKKRGEIKREKVEEVRKKDKNPLRGNFGLYPAVTLWD